MMLAETAYNVIQALPQQERDRLYSMLKLEEKEVKIKPKEDKHWTRQQATDHLLKLFAGQSKRKAAKEIKKPEAATSGLYQLKPL
ncbi:hypothetical protein [Flavobacterium beibuense]|uniref:hypothetical protein n=1 Tax=Flavobacterium beibuense TaxID=657326 RepID=UPI003A936038